MDVSHPYGRNGKAWKTYVVGTTWKSRTGRIKDRRHRLCLTILRHILGMSFLQHLSVIDSFRIRIRTEIQTIRALNDR